MIHSLVLSIGRKQISSGYSRLLTTYPHAPTRNRRCSPLIDWISECHRCVLPAAPKRVANRVQLLPHFSVAGLERLGEE